MTGDSEPPAGWLTQFRRGLLSGAGLLLLAVGVCTVPAFVAWLVPGADTSPASAAVKAGALLALAAPHGGIRLEGTEVTLTPLLVTIALGWLVAGQARRAESWSVLVGLATGYSIASGLVAKWAVLGTTRVSPSRTMLAALIFVAIIGGLARAADAGWPKLSRRRRQIVRAAAAATGCYVLVGSALAALMIVSHFHEAVGMQRQLAAGAAGLPVALLGVAATPNAILAAVGYLAGPGFQIGTHTSVSAIGLQHGPLPIFPLLAGVPSGRPVLAFGLLAIAAAALLAGWAVLRTVLRSGTWQQRITDAALAAALCGGTLAGLSLLASGRIGNGALRGIGPVWWAVGLSSTVVVMLGASAWLAVEMLRGKRLLVVVSKVYDFRAAQATKDSDHDFAADTEPAADTASIVASAEASTQRSRQVS